MRTHEFPLLALETNRDRRFPAFVNDVERPMFHVFLKIGFIHLTSNETLGVEDGVGRVGVECVFSGIANQSLVVCEADP